MLLTFRVKILRPKRLIVQFQQASNCSKSTVKTRKRCKICFNQRYYIRFILTIKTHVIDIVLVSSLLTLKIFHNLLYCFYCLLWRPHSICLEQISIGKPTKYIEVNGFPCCILNYTHFFWNQSRKSKKKSWCLEKWGRNKQSGISRRYLLWWGLFVPSLFIP